MFRKREPPDLGRTVDIADVVVCLPVFEEVIQGRVRLPIRNAQTA